MDDDDFHQACEYADASARVIYREEAKLIDGIQRKILSIALNEEPYDIFICYKENDDITINDILKIAAFNGIEAEGIFTHFALADEPENDFTKKQFDKFIFHN